MTPKKLHFIYLAALAVGIVLAAIAGNAYGDYERAQAARDATLAAQTADIIDLKKKIAADQGAAQQKISQLAQSSKAVVSHPDRAPLIIHETIPLSEPLQQTAPITIATLPDAPVAQVTKQQEIELAQFGNSCKACGVEREQLRSEVSDQNEIIDRQKKEIDAAVKASKGGSIVKRTLSIAKWVAVAGATGYVAGRFHK